MVNPLIRLAISEGVGVLVTYETFRSAPGGDFWGNF